MKTKKIVALKNVFILMLSLVSFASHGNYSKKKPEKRGNSFTQEEYVYHYIQKKFVTWDFSRLNQQNARAFVSFCINESGEVELTGIHTTHKVFAQIIEENIKQMHCTLPSNPKKLYSIWLRYEFIP